MYTVEKRGDEVLVSFARNDDQFSADGFQAMKPTDTLFGVEVGTLRDGLYDDDGKFVAPLE